MTSRSTGVGIEATIIVAGMIENLVAGTEQAKADEHASEAAPPATTKDSHIQRPAQKGHIVQDVQDVQDVAQQQRQ
jgi:hypothetical protein